MFKFVKTTTSAANLNKGNAAKQYFNKRFQSQLATTNNSSTLIDTNKNNKQKLIVNPLKHDDFFQVKSLVNLESLFK